MDLRRISLWKAKTKRPAVSRPNPCLSSSKWTCTRAPRSEAAAWTARSGSGLKRPQILTRCSCITFAGFPPPPQNQKISNYSVHALQMCTHPERATGPDLHFCSFTVWSPNDSCVFLIHQNIFWSSECNIPHKTFPNSERRELFTSSNWTKLEMWAQQL